MNVDPPNESKFPAALIVVGPIAYLVLNGLCLFVPFIPGTGVVILWGMIFPLLAVISTWTWFAQSGRRLESGLPASIFLTLTFVAAGLLTIKICMEIYSAI